MTNPTTVNDTTVAGPAGHPGPTGRRTEGIWIGLVCVAVSTLGVMAAVGMVFPDALAFVVAFVGLAVWVRRSSSRRLRWAIAGLLTVFLGFNLIYAVSDLAHPETPAPFIATVAVIGSGTITIVLAVLAARGRPGAHRLVWPIALAGLALAAVGSLAAGAAVEDDPAQPGDTVIVATHHDLTDQIMVESTSGAVVIRNGDRVRHTFVVENHLDAVELPGNSQKRVELDLEPGSYHYYCDVVGHEDLEGTLVVG